MAIIAGIALPVLLGFAGLALEYGQILAVRAEAQRTADFAAHAGAVAYVRTGGTGPMTDAARGVARLNGFGADEIVVELDTTAPGGADMAVRATITKPKRLYLPQFVGGGTSVDVVTSAVAGTTGGDPACIQALDADGSGVTMSGGTTLRADECGVASNAEVAAPCGTQIITSSLSYNSGSDPLENNCGGGDPIIDPDGNPPKVSREPTTDPLAGMAALGTAVTQMTDTASLSAPSGATSSTVPSGPDIHFAYNETFQQGTPKQVAQSLGCTANKAGSTWTFSCPGGSPVNIGTITMGGGLSLRFNTGGAQSDVYNFSGNMVSSSESMTFGDGTYNIRGDIISSGSSVTEFGSGVFNVGGAIRNDGNRMIFGDGTYDVAKGIYTSYGVTEFGAGSFRIGPASNGNAIELRSGELFMGDVNVDHGGIFEVTGRIETGGGSCLEVPAAAVHEINGPISVEGAVTFGAGFYAVDGYMHAVTGGASCRGGTNSILAEETTFMVSGVGAGPDGYGCAGKAICFSGGQDNVRFTAPTSGPFADIALIGPLDPSISAGAVFEAGASGSVVSGAFYFPNGPILFDGGASASGGSGGCLQLIGTEITLSGGTSVASECESLPQSGGSGQVVILR